MSEKEPRAGVIPVEWFAASEAALRTARAHWLSLVALSLLGGATAAVTTVLLPSYYQSSAAFQAEATTPTQLSGALAGLASQFTNLPLGSQNNAQFFADLLTTDAVLRRVATALFPWEGASAPLSRIYQFDRQPDAQRAYNTVRKLRSAINVDVNARTGTVRFTVEARTPELAEAIAESTLAALNAANIALRQGRASAERTFTADRAAHARAELDSGEAALALFYERNRLIASSPSLQVEEGRLKRTVDVAQQVYLQLRLQEEQAAAQEVRNTPAITVIDPPLVPVRRSWPNRRLATVAGLFVGLCLGLGRLLLEKRL